MLEVLSLFPAPADEDTGPGGTTVVAFRSGQDLDALLPALRRLVEGGATPSA
jgi:hypothetical protein